MSSKQRFLSIAEVGEIYGVHPRTVYAWITNGLLETRRIGPRLVRLDREHVYAVLGRPSDEPDPAPRRGGDR